MRTASYRIVSRWQVPGHLEAVADVFRETERLVDWWPAAFLEAKILDPGDEQDLGKRVWLRTKGALPYTLGLTFEITDSRYPDRFALQVEGDFEGGCVCRAWQSADRVELEFDWAVEVKKPIVRYLSWLLKPVFVENHRWVMRRGEESLRLEIERRRISAEHPVQPPPSATFPFDPLSSRLRSWILGR